MHIIPPFANTQPVSCNFMRLHVLLIIIFIFFTFTSSGQLSYNQKVKLFTDSIFAKAHRFNNNLIVASTVDSSMYTNIWNTLKEGVFLKRVTYDNGKTIIVDTFQLSVEELNQIDTFLRTQSKTSWTEEFINNAIILHKDTVNKIYSTHAGEIDSYLAKTYGDRRIFFLSKPIFLRNDTICIFEDDMDCGFLCGGGNLTIYRKVKDRWNRYMTLSEWVE